MEFNETENRRKQVLEAALNGVEKFLNSYIEDDRALEYIYEGDLQAALYSSIKKSLEDHCKFNYKQDWVISSYRETHTPTPCLVHCEQHYKGEKEKRIDIAVWDPTDKNATKDYKHKDLLLFIEVKCCSLAGDGLKLVKEDYRKLVRFSLKEYQSGLAVTFTAKGLPREGRRISVCDILKEKPIQALIVCRDRVVEILIQSSQ